MFCHENQLIERLSAPTRERLLGRCDSFELKLSSEVGNADHAPRYAHFPRHGFLSLVIDADRYPAIEVGMVGREGMLGLELLLGNARPPWRALVQGAGQSWRIDAQSLRHVMARHPDLSSLLQRCLLVRIHQQALASACERHHPSDARLARWLLMSQDRAQQPRFHLTQAFVALLLGVRRVSVTVAAGELQRLGLIHYHRGEVEVIDRAGLQAKACSCYAMDARIARELMSDGVRKRTDSDARAAHSEWPGPSLRPDPALSAEPP